MQKKKSHSGEADLLVLLVRAAPYLGSSLIFSILGYRLAHLVPSGWKELFQAFFWILLVMMVFLAEEPYWNFVLLLVFGLGAGVVVSWLCIVSLGLRTWILPGALFLLSAVGGNFFQGSARWMNRGLIISTVLFALGWISIQFLSLPDLIRVFWILFGLVLFTVVLMTIICDGKDQDREGCSISLSIHLYVTLFNLFWLSCML